MDMSKAALPARSGRYTRQDESHPLFPLYRQHLSFCTAKMIDATDFADWLYQHERNKRHDDIAKHPEFPEFQRWMVAAQGGRRKCCPTPDNPSGLHFPENFLFWKSGGRW